MDVQAFTMFVTICLKPDCAEEYLSLVNEVNNAMRHEPTFVNTVLSRGIKDPSLFKLHETWLDREDFFSVQMKHGYREKYEARLPALLQRPREMEIFDLVRGDFAFMHGSGRGALR